MALVSIEMDTAKLFDRSLLSFWAESERSKSFAVSISLQTKASRSKVRVPGNGK